MPEHPTDFAKLPTDFAQQHYAQFAGKRIVRVELHDCGAAADKLPTFIFEDGTFAHIWADLECNGPGWVGLYDLKTGTELAP